MTLSNRTKLSLVQFLAEIEIGGLDLLLEKYGARRGVISEWPARKSDIVRDWVFDATHDARFALLDELARTAGAIRNSISPHYRYDERMGELAACLELDGYRIENGGLTNIEPTIEGVVSVVDDLSAALNDSGLAEATEIQRVIDSSTENFIRQEPDYNACLVSARVALQTLATAIATRSPNAATSNHQRTNWGQTIAFLKTEGFIGPAEEQGLTGVFSLISPGAHRPIGLNEREFARLGRSLAVSMTFFLIRRYNGMRGVQ